MMEGMPASRSTAGLMSLRTRLLAISTRYTAVPTPRGTPMASAPTVTRPEPASSDMMP